MYEMTRFLGNMHSRKRRSAARFVPFVAGFDPDDLPGPLRVWDAITCNDPSAPDESLRELARRVG